MKEFQYPKDIYTEPDADVNTLANLALNRDGRCLGR